LGSIKERVFCVVDALDEMKRGNESDQFLEEFLNLQTPETVKVILTSRQVPQVERYMSGACLVDLRLDRKNVDRDIAFYLTQRLENSEMDIPVETAEILKKAICDRGKGLFLYARLMFDKLLLHPDDILSQIDSLPDGLGDMYGDILHEHVARSGTNSHFQRLILEWIIHSSRPMRLLELAVMVDALPDRGHLDPSIDAKMGIRTTCGPLLEVCEDGVVQIIHHSLTEFALNRDVSHTRMSQQKREFSVLDSASVHEMIALTCLRYLENIANKEQTSLHGMTSRQRKDMYLRHYFLQYALSEWPFHAINGPESNENLLDCLIKFFQPGNLALKFWEGLRREEWNRSHPGRWDRDCKDDVPPLFIAAHYGITFLTRHFLKNGVSPDVYDSHRLTPLVYAIERGHNEIIELLLQHQASHDVGCAEKGKPVHFAAERNNTQALQNLIVAGADMAAEKIVSDINQTYDHRNERYETSQSRDTPFLIACRQGHVETIDLLINHCQQSHLFKGLHIAILEGQLKVIEALLRVQDVRSMINDRDCNGNTALYMASKKRRSDLVECLLNSGADVNALSMNLNSPPEPPSSSPMSRKVLPSYTPVHGWAIGPQFLRTSKFKSWDNRNHPIEESVLQSLLSAGCDINAKDHRGRSALFFWSEFCSYSAEDPIIPLQVLIKQGADASILDRTGASLLHMKGTPLTLEILQLLVDSGLDINVSRCTDGATPLMLAAGSKETDPFIFQAVNADFHRQDLAGNTALFYYLRKSRRESLLQLENWIKLSNVNIQNNFGKTPFLEFLHYNGDSDEKLVEIFKKMVQQGMSIHTRDFTGKNALLTGLSHWKHYWKSGQNLIEELLSMGLNVQETDDEGKSGEFKVMIHANISH
jgi:ankyrin repeat protein